VALVEEVIERSFSSTSTIKGPVIASCVALGTCFRVVVQEHQKSHKSFQAQTYFPDLNCPRVPHRRSFPLVSALARFLAPLILQALLWFAGRSWTAVLAEGHQHALVIRIDPSPFLYLMLYCRNNRRPTSKVAVKSKK